MLADAAVFALALEADFGRAGFFAARAGFESLRAVGAGAAFARLRWAARALAFTLAERLGDFLPAGAALDLAGFLGERAFFSFAGRPTLSTGRGEAGDGCTALTF